MSDAWRAWKESVFGNDYMIWHDGLDTGAVARLRGAERAKALEMLRLGVSCGDAHAAQALAAIGDTDSIAAMRVELAKATGTARVRLALSIHRLAPDPALAVQLVEVLESKDFWSVRMDAAIGLRHFAGTGDERALLDAVERDPDYLVRNHASTSLLVRWSISPVEISEHREIFARIIGPTDNSPPQAEHFARFAEARAMLEALKGRRR